MKPILLTMEAFGAFYKAQTLDFRQLAQSPLFLIHGPTGAGKTTIFDAMCYALYGETTGERDNIRSDFAQEKDETLVDFIFAIGQKYHRIVRKLKPKRSRQTSVKDEEVEEKQEWNETQHLTEVQWNEKLQSFEAISTPITQKKEIKEKVKAIVGFEENQFKQIIVLPQGKFQEFLKADAKAKTLLLEKLFNAEIYQKITEKIKEEARRREAEIEKLQTEIEILKESYQTQSLEALQQQQTEATQQLQDLEKQLPQLNQQVEAAQNALHQAEHLTQAFEQANKTRQAYHKHLESQEKIQNLQIRLEKANKAEKCKSEVKNLENLEKEKETKEKDKKTSELRKITNEGKLNEIIRWLEKYKAEKEQEISLKEKQLFELESKLPLFETLETLQKELTQKQQELQNQQKTYEEKQTKYKTNADTLAANKDQVMPQLAQKISQKESAELKYQQLNEKLGLYDQLQKLCKSYADTEKKLKEISEALQKASTSLETSTQNYLQKERQWRAGQAYQLAMKLEENKPCPVCGSLHHPQKAMPSEAVVTDEQLDNAQEQKNNAEVTYNEIKQNHQEYTYKKESIKIQREQLNKQLGELANLKPTDFEAQMQEAQEKIAEAEKAKEDLEALKNQSETLAKANELLAQEISPLTTAIKHSEQEVVRLQTEVKANQTQLPQGITQKQQLLDNIAKINEQKKSLEEEVENKENEKTNLERLIRDDDNTIKSIIKDIKGDRVRNMEGIEEKIRKATKNLNKDLENYGFANLTEVKKYWLEESEKAQMQKEVELYNQKSISLKTLSEEANKQIENKQMPDIQVLIEQKEGIENLQKQNINQQAELKSDIERLARGYKAMALLMQKEAEIQKIAKGIKEMSELLSGKNKFNQTFQTFVLSVFLDEVVGYANNRLKLLSQERYTLARTEEVKDGRRQAGMDLEVLDKYNGKKRLVSNLSGGETFFTSLALALGLADVATAQIGGKKLEAIFIDEGFGTLDSETLDLAIRTLMQLEGEHRLVGIISHVTELKDRIPTKIEVLKHKTGSEIRTKIAYN